jgi:hypothetical protein
MRSIRLPCVLACSVLLAACGGSGPAAEGGGTAARPAAPPARAGEAWELAGAGVADAPSPAEVAAFVEGLHSIVLDGDRVYAGGNRHDAARQDDGSLSIALQSGLQARLARDGDAYLLHLGDGDPARLQRRADAAEGSR